MCFLSNKCAHCLSVFSVQMLLPQYQFKRLGEKRIAMYAFLKLVICLVRVYLDVIGGRGTNLWSSNIVFKKLQLSANKSNK